MKSLLRIVAFILFYFESNAQQSEPTLAETLDWLKLKTENTSESRPGQDESGRNTYRNFGFTSQQCDITYSYDHYIDGKLFSRETVSFSLKFVSSAELWDSGNPIITLVNGNNDKAFKFIHEYKLPPENTQESRGSFAKIYFPYDLDLSRAKKALDNAIKMCGGGKKKEKY